MNITSAQSDRIIAAAKAKAIEIAIPMSIAIVDEGANLKAFYRMDDAMLGSTDIAIKKAKTSRLFNINSGEIGKQSQPGGDLYSIEHSNDGLITFVGGILLKNHQGETVGAIGVSGGSLKQDEEVAAAGAAAL
ncbi:uncharacterized protein GlcG (DUF336 family) [Pedobacter sp. W3I1]|uniref:GlcG/HbpS family heme-binding protein n=1 Tax=Pedobacter sp. W3I1 TaxID=3042291 RepID=UPI0027864B07|nr:heme-binding protein [Pedobacter sp. W3I1]MDQ0639717.1 uncharacterized protein GlcG (DUF336 family) [Pedobacter sp. W3I1]